MKFEWDSRKARANRVKHGVEFPEAATVFYDPHGLDLPDPKHSTEREVRMLRLGMSFYSRVLLVVYTERRLERGEETIRIISARRANQEERAVYVRHL